MPTTSLEQRFARELPAEAIEEGVGFAVDFARLCVRTLGLVDPGPEERVALQRSLQARTGWSEAQVTHLLELSLLPEFRGGVSEGEIFVFSARFGEAAALDALAGVRVPAFGLDHADTRAVAVGE